MLRANLPYHRSDRRARLEVRRRCANRREARMRQIIIDTETTGLDPQQGHRIIELAALEVANRRATGRTVHFRIDPEREIDAAATEVHGMTWDDLKGKPKFRDIAAEFIAFAQGAEWIIHNAPFDIGFLDFELKQALLPCCIDIHAGVIDTLALARELFPGKRNSLDALCERFGVDNAQRSVHGALLDAQLLADVYLTMTRGQETLTIDMAPPPAVMLDPSGAAIDLAGARKTVGAIAPSADELELHRQYLLALEKESAGRCLWLALDAIAGDTAPHLAAA
jgi:DNA polymerase-3 subunit epsilon